MEVNSAAFIPVSCVDWSDTSINRAGIIPIVIEDGHKWIGLSVSQYSSIIGTFGGTYDVQDYDLLDTAVREFTEEFGDNIPPIKCEDLFSCYAVKSGYSVYVILPFHEKVTTFNSTKEVYDLLWLSPDHLRSMMNHQDMALTYGNTRHNRPRAFPFTYDLEQIALDLADILDSCSNYRITSDTSLSRSKRPHVSVCYTYVRDHDSFSNDIVALPYWDRSCVILNSDNLVICRRDEIVYIFPASDLPLVCSKLSTLLTLNIRLIVGTMADVSRLSSFSKSRKIDVLSVRQDARAHKATHTIPLNYDERLAAARDSGDIDDELNLLLECELGVYQVVAERNSYFNHKRAAFLKRVKYVTGTSFKSRSHLLTALRRKFGKSEPSPSTFVYIATQAGIIDF